MRTDNKNIVVSNNAIRDGNVYNTNLRSCSSSKLALTGVATFSSGCTNVNTDQVHSRMGELGGAVESLRETLIHLGENYGSDTASSSPTSIVPDRNRQLLFASCQFLLLGFDSIENDATRLNKGLAQSTMNPESNLEARADVVSNLHFALSRLIRRGMGTIFWEMNSFITHVVVNNDLDELTYRYVSMRSTFRLNLDKKNSRLNYNFVVIRSEMHSKACLANIRIGLLLCHIIGFCLPGNIHICKKRWHFFPDLNQLLL
jgi:hypothetical protein